MILKNADIQAVQSGVREVLKDPESARFGKMIAGRSDKGVTTVCLLVNAKNSYGGYTGMKPFMGVLTNGPPQKFIVIPTRSSQYRDESVHTVCRRDGLAL